MLALKLILGMFCCLMCLELLLVCIGYRRSFNERHRRLKKTYDEFVLELGNEILKELKNLPPDSPFLKP